MAKPDATKGTEDQSEESEAGKVRFCGIVRPIADMGTYTAKHWREVHNVISEAVEPLDLTLRLVSESDAAGVILSEIVTNLYSDEIVIVDVSGRNPNVMFELGMRLAFQKPAIIVMDDETPFSFDISPVKHIRYPRTLRYADVVQFKEDIRLAVIGTLAINPDKRNYLQQFGPVEITKLDSKSADVSMIVQDIKELRRMLVGMSRSSDSIESAKRDARFARKEEFLRNGNRASFIDVDAPQDKASIFFDRLVSLGGISDVEVLADGYRIYFQDMSGEDLSNLRNSIRAMARELRLS